MTGLEDLIAAAMSAPPERRDEALRLLRGQLPKPEPFLTLSELARRVGVYRGTLRRWRVPGHDLGGRRRYRLTEVEAYLATEEFQRRQAALRAERRSVVARITPSLWRQPSPARLTSPTHSDRNPET